jgi:Ca-activated chloride channel family protein
LPVSLWPQTWTSVLVATLLAAGLIAAICWLAWRHYADRYRREALADLDRIMQASAPNAGALELLVRRTALVVFPRDEIVPLTGPAWLTFLDKTYGGHEFSQGAGRRLSLAPYSPQQVPLAELGLLADLVRRWIRTHHV